MAAKREIHLKLTDPSTDLASLVGHEVLLTATTAPYRQFRMLVTHLVIEQGGESGELRMREVDVP